MDVTKKSRLQLRIQNLLFYISFLSVVGLLAFLSNKYNVEYDFTATNKHTLSDASITVLQRMPQEINIRVFVRASDVQPIRKVIAEKLLQYTRVKPDIVIEYINPDTNPDVIRKLSIKVDGEIIVTYNGRSEHLEFLSEELLTNSLLRLLRSKNNSIVFITGHGERRVNGKANYDLEIFTTYLNKTGIKTTNIDLNSTPVIPATAAAIVIASPQIAYLPGEVTIIKNYINKGGNLLWLHEPGSLYGLEPLAKSLNISFEPGTVVDPSAQLYGISSPTISLVTKYNTHAITNDFSLITVYPQAVALKYTSPEPAANSNIEQSTATKSKNWTSSIILQTVARSWSETGVLQGTIDFSAEKDIPGPLSLGIALSYTPETKKSKSATIATTQRIVILGDGDFLSNTYIGNQGNRDFGVNVFNWISHDDNFIAIPSKIAIDTNITIGQKSWWIIALLLLIILPLLIVLAGIIIWRSRSKK